MRYSGFTTYGLLRFSGAKPVAQKVYDDLVDALGAAFDLSPGTYVQAKLFAKAKATAVAASAVEVAKNARFPGQTYDLIPAWESRMRVVPGPADTAAQRQATLAAKAQAPTGASVSAIVGALQALLGAAFVAYVPMTIAQTKAFAYPQDPTLTGTYPSATTPQSLFTLLTPTAALGFTLTVQYSPVTAGALLQVGNRIIVQTENWSQVEVVKVVAVNNAASPPTFTAVFNTAHDAGSSVFYGRKPLWTSPKRYSLIVVKSAYALDPITRSKISAVMNDHARCVSQWGIAQPSVSSPGTAGPWAVGNPVGVIPIGSVTL